MIKLITFSAMDFIHSKTKSIFGYDFGYNNCIFRTLYFYDNLPGANLLHV